MVKKNSKGLQRLCLNININQKVVFSWKFYIEALAGAFRPDAARDSNWYDAVHIDTAPITESFPLFVP